MCRFTETKMFNVHPLFIKRNNFMGFKERAKYLHTVVCYFCCTTLEPFLNSFTKQKAMLEAFKILHAQQQQLNIYNLSGIIFSVFV